MKTPIIRAIERPRIIPSLVAIGLVSFAFKTLAQLNDWALSFLLGYLFITAYRFLVRFTLTKYHAKGIRMMKAGRFHEAIDAFQESFGFFDKYSFLDRWRSFVFLMPGKYDYKEMALLNLGYIYGQIGEGHSAEEVYKKCLDLYPNNGIAESALNLLNSKT